MSLLHILPFFLVLGGDLTPASKELVKVKVTPNICQAPCQVRITITVHAPEGTPVCVELSNLDYERRSCWPHRGFSITDVTIRNIPAGEYKVGGAIRLNDMVHRAIANLRVLDQYSVYSEEPRG